MTIAQKGIQFADQIDPDQFRIKGFVECVISVRDLAASSQFYRRISGWEECCTSTSSQEQLHFWLLPGSASAEEILMCNIGESNGHTRLVAFDNVDQDVIRANSMSWDTGGIYDLDIRVADMQATYSELQAAGWSGFSSPQTYEFGHFHVTEVLMKGPDDVVLALIKRHKPKLEGWDNMRQMSHVFNSSQIVSNMDEAKEFYMNILGFKIYMEHNMRGSEHEDNLFGMPQNLYQTIERKITILNPTGTNVGSVELVELHGADGRDFSERAKPPNLGLLMLRFPVQNIDAFRSHLIQKGQAITSDIAEICIEPYGKCAVIAIQSPDGAWLEFIEKIE